VNSPKITIQDIAKRLGYCASTVSRALNDKPGVSEAVKAEIRVLALEMGYDLKQIYRKAKKRDAQNWSISVVVTRDNFIDEFFFKTIICAIENTLFQKGIITNFTIIEHKNHDVLSILKKLKPDGVLIFGLVDKEKIAEVIFSGVPTVLVDTPIIQLKTDRITINNYKGCFDAASYLVQAGHTRVSFLGDVDFSDNVRLRYEGCRDGLKKAGGTLVQAGGIVSMSMCGSVYIDEEKLKTLLSSENRPTAVICANDRIAFELYGILKTFGLSVPEDLSIIGFDNVEKCEKVSPPLTSIRVPRSELGQEAVRMLLERLENPGKITSLLQLDVELVERGSVSKPSERER